MEIKELLGWSNCQLHCNVRVETSNVIIAEFPWLKDELRQAPLRGAIPILMKLKGGPVAYMPLEPIPGASSAGVLGGSHTPVFMLHASPAAGLRSTPVRVLGATGIPR